jgi:hypothetical protein
MDPDPAVLVIDLQDANKTLILLNVFSADYLLFEGTFTSIFKYKIQKEVTKQQSRNLGFSYYFC